VVELAALDFCDADPVVADRPSRLLEQLGGFGRVVRVDLLDVRVVGEGDGRELTVGEGVELEVEGRLPGRDPGVANVRDPIVSQPSGERKYQDGASDTACKTVSPAQTCVFAGSSRGVAMTA
jgi:hypothetical protein